MRTSALFDPLLKESRYQQQKALLLPQDVLREEVLYDSNNTYVWELSGPNDTRLHLAAKRFESMEEAEKEYELGAGLVEPPQWHLLTDRRLSKPETATAQKWLLKRKKHQGFKHILHYRYCVDIPGGGAAILMDLYDTTLAFTLRREEEYWCQDQNPQVLPQPVVDAQEQVNLGLNYLTTLALVDYPLTNLQHVKRVGPKWCIGDFGSAERMQGADVVTVLAKNLDLFNDALLGAVLTTRMENGDHVLRADLLKRTKTPARSYVSVTPASSYVSVTPASSYVRVTPASSFVGVTPASSYVGMTPASSHEAAHSPRASSHRAAHDIPRTPPPADHDITQPASAKEFTADKGLYAAAALGGLLALAGGAQWLATQGLH